MSNIKLYIINYTVPQYNKIGIASVTAISAQKAQSILQATGKYNAYKYNMSYPVLVHTTDTFTAESIITELDNPAGEKGDRGPQGLKGDRGDKGDPGEPMTWEKMDPEDKISLKEDIEDNVKHDIIYNKYYPSMSVGMADNLVGRGDLQDAHINFRPSAGEANITDHAARIKAIKGNSVVWNQLVQNADFRNGSDRWSATLVNFIKQSDCMVLETTASGNQQITQAFTNKIPANHKVLIMCDIQRETAASFPFYTYLKKAGISEFETSIIPAYSSQQREVIASIITTTAEIDSMRIYPTPQAEAGTRTRIYSITAIDLTKEFNAGNEPTSYEEYLLRKPMNIEDEFAHNEGELIDMKVDSLVSVGDNAWDEEWENGTFNTTTGANIDAIKTQIRSKNLIKVLPNTNYTCTIPTKLGADSIWCMLLDKDKEVITGYNVPNAASSGNTFGLTRYAPSFTTPANAAYLKFYCPKVYGAVYTNDTCFHLKHSEYKNGKYYPYQQDVKDLSFIGEAFPEGMRSAGSTYDEIRFNPTEKVWEKIVRVGVRAYAEGDAEDSSVTTDGETTNYPLDNPTPTTIDLSPNFNLDYFAWDFGTEEAIVPNNAPSAPFRADINYEPNAVDDLRWAVSEIRQLKAQLAEMQSAQVSENSIIE